VIHLIVSVALGVVPALSAGAAIGYARTLPIERPSLTRQAPSPGTSAGPSGAADTQVGKQANKQAGKQVGKQANKQADKPADTPADKQAEAYYQFITGHRRGAEGDADGASKALRLAMELDPASSQIPAELAELLARQGLVTEAVDLAEAALKTNDTNWDAHRLLGMLYADQAERAQARGTDAADASRWQRAVDHLEKALSDSDSDMTTGVRLTLARIYLQRQQYDRAIAALKQALADSPWLRQAVSLLVETYTAAGKPAEAAALLKDAVEEDPSFYPALADAYDKQQRYAEAAVAFEKASEQNPRDVELKIKWAAALLNRPETASAERARDLLLEVTRTNPAAGWPLYLLARAQRFLEDLDGAEATARQILALNPSSTSGAHALAQVFEARRQFSKIVETLEPVMAKAPQKGHEVDEVLLLTHIGFAHLELGRGPEAAAVFDRAIQLNPDDVALKTYRAQATVLARKYELAITLLRDLRAGRPGDPRLARLEADALRGMGKFDAGVAVLKPLADAAGAGSNGVLTLSEFYAADHRYADAAALLKTAEPRFPDDLNLRFQYAAMLERLKKHDEAERILRQVIAADPHHAPALNYLGYTLIERGQRLTEALGLIRRAVALDPYNGAYLDSLGWAYFRLKQFEAAETNLRTAADQLVGDSVVQDHFGDVLAARNRFADAVEAWRRALAGDGESIDREKIERKIREAQPKAGKK